MTINRRFTGLLGLLLSIMPGQLDQERVQEAEQERLEVAPPRHGGRCGERVPSREEEGGHEELGTEMKIYQLLRFINEKELKILICFIMLNIPVTILGQIYHASGGQMEKVTNGLT